MNFENNQKDFNVITQVVLMHFNKCYICTTLLNR